METVLSALREIRDINTAWDLPADAVDRLQEEIADASVCIPIIGKFSSGKSALVNTVLGYSRKILKEDITPETAIPAEIIYSDSADAVSVLKNDGSTETLSVDAYRSYTADANTAVSARIQLRNSFLEEIPDVMLVDMPGFESGFEIHNRAIDSYLPKSLAYIIAFPADDMIVRSSVGNILKELCLHDMPLCIVITKYDKRGEDFEHTLAKMKESLKRYVGERELRCCRTSSFDGDSDELREFLREIQEKSQEILAKKYRGLALSIVENTESYLKTALSGGRLSESELDEQEEKLSRQLSSLESGFTGEKSKFEAELQECAQEINDDLQRTLEAEEPTLVAMALNGQSINEHLNTVVRSAVTTGVQKHFIPKVEKYLKNVSKTINSESVGDVHVSFTFDSGKLSKGMTSAIVAVSAGILLGIPLLGLLAGIFMKLRSNKKREEAKREISHKLKSEVFPQILNEVRKGIEMTIAKQVTLVNTSIEGELTSQRTALEKALSDVRVRMDDEKEQKAAREHSLSRDLERTGELKDGLR